MPDNCFNSDSQIPPYTTTPQTPISGNTGTPQTCSLCPPHVSPTATWANEEDRVTIETYSSYVLEFWIAFVPESAFWKTFLDSLQASPAWHYGGYCTAWSVQGMGTQFSRFLFRLEALEPYIYGVGSGWLPTPTRNDGQQVQFPPSQANRHKGSRGTLISMLMQHGCRPPANPLFWEYMMGYPPYWTALDQDNKFPLWETLLPPP